MATNNALNNSSGEITIDPGSSGDSFIQFDINTTGEFRIGVDDDATDSFKISQGSALGTNDTFITTASGEITQPLQPAFFVTTSSTASNVTGDGTVYTVVFGTEIFDQNSDFDGTSTFTAPVTGRYFFTSSVRTDGNTDSNDEGEIRIVTSNRTYFSRFCGSLGRNTASGRIMLDIGALCDMDSSDTTYIDIVWDGSTKILDVPAASGSTLVCIFSGSLVC